MSLDSIADAYQAKDQRMIGRIISSVEESINYLSIRTHTHARFIFELHCFLLALIHDYLKSIYTLFDGGASHC
ncbi:MAG: hypothetical protein M3270_06650 [Thermoproteota archaeon]|nr:hypothetical protein [Thermoproteota archaeon]